MEKICIILELIDYNAHGTTPQCFREDNLTSDWPALILFYNWIYKADCKLLVLITLNYLASRRFLSELLSLLNKQFSQLRDVVNKLH